MIYFFAMHFVTNLLFKSVGIINVIRLSAVLYFLVQSLLYCL